MTDSSANPAVARLLARGVSMEHPASVVVGDEVDPARIAPGVRLGAGTRLFGKSLSIGPGCSLGDETPMTVRDCQLERGVALKGGYAEGAVFLAGATMGSGAHIRPGTLIEEEAGGAHTVGLKQTVLLPFVTLGSLINFCDILMAGGTSRKDHSEVGSSYIHFNFTPHQDKATASLVGDVPRGVMLDQPPIFLGGQGGLVGPSRIAFGAVIPAGTVYRGDAEAGGAIHYPDALPAGQARPYRTGVYKDIARVVRNNLAYIGNLKALRAWYRQARQPFLTRDGFGAACLEGALVQIESMLNERIKRLGGVIDKLPGSVEALASGRHGDRAAEVSRQKAWIAAWPEVEAACTADAGDAGDSPDARTALDALAAAEADDYLAAVKRLPAEAKDAGARWLQGIVDATATLAESKGTQG